MKHRLFLILFIALTVGISCNNQNEPKVSEKKTINKNLTDTERIIGIWTNKKKSFWIEINADGTFCRGKNGKVEVKNEKWQIDEKEHILYFKKPDAVKSLRYKFENGNLLITEPKKSKRATLYRIDNRPE